MTDVHFLHVRDGGRAWWVFYDTTRMVRGRIAETQDDVLARWTKLHGTPAKLVRVEGYHGTAEAAATIADHQFKG